MDMTGLDARTIHETVASLAVDISLTITDELIDNEEDRTAPESVGVVGNLGEMIINHIPEVEKFTADQVDCIVSIIISMINGWIENDEEETTIRYNRRTTLEDPTVLLSPLVGVEMISGLSINVHANTH